MVATYCFGSRKVMQTTSVAQSCSMPILSRNGRNIPFWGRAKSLISDLSCKLLGSRKVIHFWGRKIASYLFWVAQSRANYFNCTKLQHAHFESQWSQHTFLGSRKVASYPFWVAQSRANCFGCTKRSMHILSRNGRNIPFWGRAKSHHICFGSKSCKLLRLHKVAACTF